MTTLHLTTRRLWPLLTFALLISLLMLGCGGTPPPEDTTEREATTDTPSDTPSDSPERVLPEGDDIQQPDQPNPTGTPVGESRRAQPLDTPAATLEVPSGTPMTTPQEQALALLNFMERNADAPRWVLTWEAGAGQLDLDAVTGILSITNPDGSTIHNEGVDRTVVESVSRAERDWVG